MDKVDFIAAKPLQAIIDAATAAQAKNATAGAKAIVTIVDEKDSVLVNSGTLSEIMGAAYDTLCNTALGSVNSGLVTAKSDAQTEFDLLGV